MTPQQFGAAILQVLAQVNVPITRPAQNNSTALLDIAEALAAGRLTLAEVQKAEEK
jgi:hypothetical protein